MKELPLLRGEEIPAVICQGEFLPEQVSVPMAGVRVVVEGTLGALFGLLPEILFVHNLNCLVAKIKVRIAK